MQHLKIMTRKEQNKILNDKIEANNAQYDLDRMMPKYQLIRVVICLNTNI